MTTADRRIRTQRNCDGSHCAKDCTRDEMCSSGPIRIPYNDPPPLGGACAILFRRSRSRSFLAGRNEAPAGIIGFRPRMQLASSSGVIPARRSRRPRTCGLCFRRLLPSRRLTICGQPMPVEGSLVLHPCCSARQEIRGFRWRFARLRTSAPEELQVITGS